VLSIQDNQKPDTTSEAAQKATAERIKPLPSWCALDANDPPRSKIIGQKSTQTRCVQRVTRQVRWSRPKFDNKGDWSSRIAQVMTTLVNTRTLSTGIAPGVPRRAVATRSVRYRKSHAAVAYLAKLGWCENSPRRKRRTCRRSRSCSEQVQAIQQQRWRKPDPAKAGCLRCELRSLSRRGTDVPSRSRAQAVSGCKAAEAARYWSQGFEVCITPALNGKNAMPAKGGNAAA